MKCELELLAVAHGQDSTGVLSDSVAYRTEPNLLVPCNMEYEPPMRFERALSSGDSVLNPVP